MPKQEFDDQGKLFWHLARKAGWDDARISKYLLKKFSATHWNALDTMQRREAISTMRRYCKAREKDLIKPLRQSIMAMVAKNGKDLDWLHERMEAWGAGNSLRKCSYGETVQIYELIKQCFPGQTAPGGSGAVTEDGVTYEYGKLKGEK